MSTSQYPYYTTNLCSNGSFEVDPIGPLLPLGWSVITGQETTYIQAYGDALPQYGNQCLQVNTPGLQSGEGVIGPLSPYFTTTATGSMTIGIRGQLGNLIITAMATPDNITNGVPLASQNVQLDDQFNYVTITLNNLSIQNATQVYIIVQTVGEEALEFFLDGVQYEPESPAHPYIDGSFPGCTWGQPPPAIPTTPFESWSCQQFQNPISAITGFLFGGSVRFIDVGEVFPWKTLGVTEFKFSDTTDPSWSLLQPIAAMTDFALFNPGVTSNLDPDPAMTYALWNNAGVNSGSGSYSRPYAMVVPPGDYPTSNGNYAWQRAAYMGLGFQWAAVPTVKSQVITDVQLEYAPVNGVTAITPSNFQQPRQLQVIIKPNRLNYVPNPSFEGATGAGSTAQWSGSGTGSTPTTVGGLAWSATVSYSTGNTVVYGSYVYTSNINSNLNNPPTGLISNNTQWNYLAPASPQNVAIYQNIDYSPGNYTMKVSLASTAATGVQIALAYLIPGETYIASAYVYGSNQLSDILISCNGASGDIIGATTEGPDFIPPGAQPYGGAATGFLTTTPYGSGSYGGLANPNVPLPQEWFRISVVFTASADTETLSISPEYLSGATFSTVFYVDAVLCELGDALLSYFDGNSGPDAMWLSGGTNGLCQSFYYESFEYGQHVVTDALKANTPMGISYATPIYATIPTQ